MNNIKKAYYTAVSKWFINRKKSAQTDDLYIKNNMQVFKELQPYFKDYLENIWIDFFKYNNPDDVKYPYIGVFVQYGLMHKMYKNINMYKDNNINKISKYLLRHKELFIAIVNDDIDFKYDYIFSPVDIDFYLKGTNKNNGDNYLQPKEQNRLKRYFYNKIIDEIGEE